MARTQSAIHDINTSNPASSQFGNPASHFGKQVRKERVARGWTIRDLSRVSELDPGHLSRIERGRSSPTEYTAAKLDKTFPHRKGWFSEFQRDSQAWTPAGYRHWTEYETPAALIRAWSPGGMHGLVQTEAYARALFVTMPDVAEDVVETRLAGRAERQRRILHRANPPEVWILVDELALYREVGSPEVMAEQLDHLLTVAAMPNVTVQIVPARAHPVIGYGMVIADNAAYTEHAVRGYVYTEPETATPLTRIMSSLQAESYRASETIRMIERVRDIWARGVNPLTAALTAESASK